MSKMLLEVNQLEMLLEVNQLEMLLEVSKKKWKTTSTSVRFLEVKTYLVLIELEIKIPTWKLNYLKHKQTNISKQKTENLFAISKKQIHKRNITI